jgi:hypothetical protein
MRDPKGVDLNGWQSLLAFSWSPGCRPLVGSGAVSTFISMSREGQQVVRASHTFFFLPLFKPKRQNGLHVSQGFSVHFLYLIVS